MPLVTVPSRPNGDPMATVGWPGLRVLELPRVTGWRPPGTFDGSTRITARSAERSAPRSLTGMASPFSPKRTFSAVALSTTCSLVTMSPWLSITKPDPEAWPLG